MGVIDEVAAERKRQTEQEGWTLEHDDTHRSGGLSLAAVLYAIPYDSGLVTQEDFFGLHMALEIGCEWQLKPEPNKRRRLIKAAALIVAEIERLDRAANG